MNNCIKNCECDECELLQINYPITFIEQGIYNKRETLVGFKCGWNGNCAETKHNLKHGKVYTDNLIFIGE